MLVPLHFVLPTVSVNIRDSSRSPSTGVSRPNVLFIVEGVCVFRGEEKATEAELETPRRELVDKLEWSNGDVPYLFGYAAAGHIVRLYAFVHGDRSQTVELGMFDLPDLRDRFRWVLAIINVSRLLESLARMCPDSARDEYLKLPRANDITVLLEPKRVVKKIPREQYQVAKSLAQNVYMKLKIHSVPHVDTLVLAEGTTNSLHFIPRGFAVQPSDIIELFQAVGHVLEALTRMHAASLMHRDIRWSNVIKSRDEQESWFLIDFMDAAFSPQNAPSRRHLTHADHAPEIFDDDSHDTAVDIWSVGLLIQTSSVYSSWYDLGGTRTQFVELLMRRNPSERPSAVEALSRLLYLKENYKPKRKDGGPGRPATRKQWKK